MGVLASKNSVTCKIHFIGKHDYSQKKRFIDEHLNHPLPANAIVWLQYLYPLNMIGVPPLLSAECDIPQTEKLEIHELTARHLLTGL
jgi:hypothetical protein